MFHESYVSLVILPVCLEVIITKTQVNCANSVAAYVRGVYAGNPNCIYSIYSPKYLEESILLLPAGKNNYRF